MPLKRSGILLPRPSMTPETLRRLSRPALALAAAALLAGLAGALASSRAADDKKAAAPRPALTVTTAKPTSARLPVHLAANGNVAAWQEAVIGSESNGLDRKSVV